MNKVFFTALLWLAIDFVTPFSFAQTSTDSAKESVPEKILPSLVPYPSSGFPPGIKCGACLESVITEIKVPKSSVPSPSGADVKGVQATPEPTPKKVSKPTLKPVISPLPSPSASISAPPSAKPTLEPVEKKETSTIIKIWNWILELFKK